MAYLTMSRVMKCLLFQQSASSRCLFATGLVKLINLYLEFSQPSQEDDCSQHVAKLEETGSLDEGEVQDLLVLIDSMKESVVTSLHPVLEPFRSFCTSQAHFWICLMIDPRFKRLRTVRKLQQLSDEFRVSELIFQYEGEVLFPCLVACYKILNPSASDLEEESDVDSMDFEHYRTTCEEADRVTSLVKDEYRRFRRMKDLEPTGDPLTWFRVYQSTFPTVSFLAKQFLSISHSQIAVERVFSVAGILTANRRNRLAISNLDTIVFINKNSDLVYSRNLKTSSVEEFVEREIELLREYEEEFGVSQESDDESEEQN